MGKYKSVIFDLDGTLLDTLLDLVNAVNHTMDAFGFPRHTVEEVKTYVGNGVDELIALSVPQGRENPRFSDAVTEYRRFYGENSEIMTKAYDGINDLISALKKEGILVSVVSNKMHSATVALCKKYFPEIEHANGEREKDGIRRKPHPDMLLKTIEELGVSSEECVYVGDSEVDIITSRNAGVDCISVLWGFRDRDYLIECGAGMMAENAQQLYDLIIG